jgi:pimeloyl-ACP methyl ester carboxylesterase
MMPRLRLMSASRLVAVIVSTVILFGCGTYSHLEEISTGSIDKKAFADFAAEASKPPKAIETAAKPADPPKPVEQAQLAQTPIERVALMRSEPRETAAPVTSSAPTKPRGHVYLFRGIGGRLASLDLDHLATKIRRSGLSATVYNFTEWREPAGQVIARARRDGDAGPVILVGHSAGGDATLSFAERLKEARIPVNLIITFDPTRRAGRVPANVDRYINIYQSLNFFGGGDVKPDDDFRGHYASVDLKRYWEVLHVNLVKLGNLQDKVAEKIVQVANSSRNLEGLTVPIKYVMPRNVPIELWDSGLPVTAEAGDTIASLARRYAVPVWAVAQLNNLELPTTLRAGRRIVIPRNLDVPLTSPVLTSFAPSGR